MWLDRANSPVGNGQITIKPPDSLNRSSGEDWVIVVESSEAIRGLQFEFDLYSQEGLINVQKSTIAEPFELDHSVIDNHVIIVLYPISGYVIPPGIHELISLDFESLNRSINTTPLELHNIILANEYGQRINLKDSPNRPIEMVLNITPNPFNPITIIDFDLPQETNVSLIVYDMMGKEVAVLIDSRKTVGNHSVIWNATGFASSMYFVRLETPWFTETQKIMLLK